MTLMLMLMTLSQAFSKRYDGSCQLCCHECDGDSSVLCTARQWNPSVSSALDDPPEQTASPKRPPEFLQLIGAVDDGVVEMLVTPQDAHGSLPLSQSWLS